MQHKPTNKDSGRKAPLNTGFGLAIGAALGMIFGMMLFDQLAYGALIGAGAGLIIGAVLDAQKH